MNGDRMMDEPVVTMDAASGTPPRNARVTLEDVAQASGVSRATVSYVLNDTPGRAISERTRELVHETARRLGHVPNAAARALRSGKSSVVLALLPSFSRGYVADRVLETLDEALSARGYALAVHHYDPTRRTLTELWGMISPAIVVALAGLSLSDESVIQRADARLVGVHNNLNHAYAGGMQVDYLVSRGHSRIGYLYPDHPNLAGVADARWSGAEARARELGLADLVRTQTNPLDPDLAAAFELWASAGVSAVCVHNDQMASMVLLEMARRGMTAPDDLAVIGQDNAPVARMGITTIAIDIDDYSQFVTDSVIASLEGGVQPTPRSRFFTLVVRESA